ncbi:MAG TPA: nucleoside hydrolase [Porphyromonadaceae bacterium]|jgi:inosine-uridine nucleoside N-ribohydrolase|uniref:nucleoside hydrolase n=1 Tax=Petrimonas sulfuriphila TaxID=285070 RepID=UPI000E833EE7|nr:nucleoside hydrolase [Porphyromonadaceae bacterium]HBC37288.1 nucleoside hydrolase [Porphyromonadaceae bacterium]HBF96106.1 nucleoside hydrolase [Porphyromonadaceae bacterium]HBG80882.1 nucleoside hydrolase [Porphyromonadaceae bacterium]HBK42494.1 nucleoside hydrolase [Porphyromonadaceae bacterium]
MKALLVYLLIPLLVFFSCNSNPQEGAVASPEKIIFDTDMGPDYDDVGAIAILHALADLGECEILATLASDGHPSIAPTIEMFNRYYGKGGIPVGIPDNGVANFTASNNWNDSLLVRFAPDLKSKTDYPKASEIYRKVLASQPDKSVTIVTVGFTTNLAELLKTGNDDYSPLSGVELIKKKVKKWVAMAGRFPEGREFNVFIDSVSSSYVLERWPTPILFSGFEIGERIFTGSKVAEKNDQNNPVSWAYKYNLATYENKPVKNRMSWDQTAVLCAIRDPERYFYVCGPGKIIVNPSGYNNWDPDSTKDHYFLVHKYPYQDISDTLEGLMMYQPK